MSKARAGVAAKLAIPQKTRTRLRYFMAVPPNGSPSNEAEDTSKLPAEEGRKEGKNGKRPGPSLPSLPASSENPVCSANARALIQAFADGPPHPLCRHRGLVFSLAPSAHGPRRQGSGLRGACCDQADGRQGGHRAARLRAAWAQLEPGKSLALGEPFGHRRAQAAPSRAEPG